MTERRTVQGEFRIIFLKTCYRLEVLLADLLRDPLFRHKPIARCTPSSHATQKRWPPIHFYSSICAMIFHFRLRFSRRASLGGKLVNQIVNCSNPLPAMCSLSPELLHGPGFGCVRPADCPSALTFGLKVPIFPVRISSLPNPRTPCRTGSYRCYILKARLWYPKH